MFPEAIQHADENLFFLINREWANSFFDTVLPPLRDKYFWIPLYALIAILIALKFRMKSIVPILLLAANFAASDQLSSAVFKPLFSRERPCNNELINDEVTLRIDRCGVGKSFPSSHATNTMAFAMMLSLLFGRHSKWIVIAAFLWAFSICYAQVYVGVHYPLDIAGGCLLGILVATVLYISSKKLLFRRVGFEP